MRDGGRELNAGRQSRRAFFRHLRRVVAASDVILQVLDARDPAGCRCVLSSPPYPLPSLDMADAHVTPQGSRGGGRHFGQGRDQEDRAGAE